MSLLDRLRGREGEPVDPLTRVVRGPARPGRRTKRLVKDLRRGDIAILDHRDLDRVCAEDLVACGVPAVVNCQPSSSSAYPNMGPVLLVDAGVLLVEVAGDDLFDAVRDGEEIALEGGEVRNAAGDLLATGRVRTPQEVHADHERQRREIGEALTEFVTNTVEHMEAEQELLTGDFPLPPLDVDFDGRHALVVVRGVNHQRDLKALRPYIRDLRPVLIGVDGGADAILEEGLVPDLVVGDMDSAAESSLRSGAQVVVHAYRDGRAPGAERLDRLGVSYVTSSIPGTSQDIAMLIAHERGAELICTVGSQFNLVEFLDKARPGMASTFLTRLRIGEKLVDAKGVSRLYRPRPGLAPVAVVGVVGLVAIVVAIAASPGLSGVADLLLLKLRVLLGFGP